jgi:hypothetical protein
LTTTALIQERGTTHGRFVDNARFAQALRAIWRQSPHWDVMPEEHREALDHMAGKLSRILSGQSRHEDHWADIGGYAELARKASKDPNAVWCPGCEEQVPNPHFCKPKP